MEKPYPSAEVIKLAEKLISELDNNWPDTLTRWMLHRLAELKVKADSEKDPIEKEGINQKVQELTLKIWDRTKGDIPANPLKSYEPVIELLKRLVEPGYSFLWLIREEQKSGLGDLLKKIQDKANTILEIGLTYSLIENDLMGPIDWENIQHFFNDREVLIAKLLDEFKDQQSKDQVNKDLQKMTSDERRNAVIDKFQEYVEGIQADLNVYKRSL